MISLFLDTSSEDLYVSIIKDNILLYEKNIKTIKDHSIYLMNVIKEGLSINNIKVNEIKKIYVTIGPGSFTGTRIGVTVAKTLAWSLGINVIPVSSLKQYIFEYNSYDYYVPIIEDKKGLYFSIYDKDYNNFSNEKYLSKEDFLFELSNLSGNVLLISNNAYEKYLTKPKKINSIKMIEYYKHEKEINPHELKPNYIKKIEVESKL